MRECIDRVMSDAAASPADVPPAASPASALAAAPATSPAAAPQRYHTLHSSRVVRSLLHTLMLSFCVSLCWALCYSALFFAGCRERLYSNNHSTKIFWQVMIRMSKLIWSVGMIWYFCGIPKSFVWHWKRNLPKTWQSVCLYCCSCIHYTNIQTLFFDIWYLLLTVSLLVCSFNFTSLGCISYVLWLYPGQFFCLTERPKTAYWNRPLMPWNSYTLLLHDHQLGLECPALIGLQRGLSLSSGRKRPSGQSGNLD